MGGLPNGPGGVNPDAKFGLIGGQGISGLPDRTRGNIEQLLKQMYYGPGGPLRPPVQWPQIQLPDGPLLWSMFQALGRNLLAAGDHIWDNLDDLFEDLLTIPQTLTEHTEVIANLEEIAAAGRTTAAYVGDLSDMVTVPRSQMVQLSDTGGGAGGFDMSCADNSHSHSFDWYVPRDRPGYSNGLGAPSRGDIWYTPVVVDREAYVHKIRWVCGTDSAPFGQQFYEMALCVYNPTTAAIEKVWTSGNIKDTTANTSTLQEVEIDMTTGVGAIVQQCSPGQILFVAHQQTAPGIGQQARTIGVVPQGGIARPSSMLLDSSMWYADNYTQGIPSTIPFADLTGLNSRIPWAAVSTLVDAP